MGENECAMSRIVREAGKYRRAHPELRYGQSVFIVANHLYPKRTDALRGKPCDCFYDDAKVDLFLEAIEHEGIRSTLPTPAARAGDDSKPQPPQRAEGDR